MLTFTYNEVKSMISYEPFWRMLHEQNISTYKLIYEDGILPDTIQRLRKGRPITTKTINTICSVLGCSISDIMEFIPEEDDSKEEKGLNL